MAIDLSPQNELVIGGLSATIVYSIFALNVPSYADVRHDVPGNGNTYASVNTATWTATAVVSALALLSRSPTVFVIGGAMILVETWKYHVANFSKHGSQEAPILSGQ